MSFTAEAEADLGCAREGRLNDLVCICCIELAGVRGTDKVAAVQRVETLKLREREREVRIVRPLGCASSGPRGERLLRRQRRVPGRSA
ncbi:MAG: hypothetical protein JWO17_954 [Actinomycetia bacterium]|nr:hypothetical protein [Actinomycetes bacterium]